MVRVRAVVSTLLIVASAAVRVVFSIRPTWSLKGRRFQGLRGFTGKPFHPPLTDFPIVCYTLAAIFDLISFFSDGSDPKAHDFFVAATFVLSIPTPPWHR